MKRKLAAFAIFALGLTVGCCAQAPVTRVAVNLTWQAPASSPDPVAGYNVYRDPTGGTNFTQIGTTTLTAFTDLNVSSGETCDYMVESVDAQGNTSAPSNEASVTLPTLPPAMAQPTLTINP